MDTVRLSKRIRAVLVHPANEVFVSAVTFWELSLKAGLGKLRLEGVSPAQLPSVAERMGFRVLPLDADLAASFHELPAVETHRDPFDRMLIWTAIRRGWTLVSRDDRLAPYERHGLRWIWR